MPPARPASLKVRALQWLAQREHSRLELRQKLLRLARRPARAAGGTHTATGDAAAEPLDAHAAAAEVDAVLQWLAENGHLSDARFTESRVHARQARFGNRRIQQELQQHGVALDEAARHALAGSEFDRASALWQRKFGAVAADPAARLRQMRFLVGRGFSMDVVRRLVRPGARADADTDTDTDTDTHSDSGGTTCRL